MGLFRDQELFDRLVNFSISRGLSEHYKSLLRIISAQDIPLKNKLLGKPKLAAFSLIFSPVAQRSMGSSFAQEDKSTVFHLLQSSDWWATNLYWNGDYSSSWFFCFIQSHKLGKVPENQQKGFGPPHTFQGRSISRIPPSRDL